MIASLGSLLRSRAAFVRAAAVARPSAALVSGSLPSTAVAGGPVTAAATLPPRRGFAGISDEIIPENIVQHAYTTGGKKYLPGFSFPAPRRLEQIVKYALLEREPPAKIKEIWNMYHDGRLDCVATTWSKEEFEGIQERKRRCPRFVYPVHKGDGKFFNLVAEWQDKYCIFTFLDDYRRNPTRAEPYLSVALFDDFLDRKGLVLVRGDFSGHLLKRDAAHLVNLMRYFYFAEPKWVEAFNTDPAGFNFDTYLRECPPPPPVGSGAAGKVDRPV